jgi:hypothetical protein
MSKIITVKLEKAGNRVGPFNISDNYGNVLGTGVTKQELIDGVSYTVDDAVTVIILESIGKCKTTKFLSITSLSFRQLAEIQFTPQNTATMWKHLTNTTLYNSYYGNIEPYIIEYPFAYQFQDEILQNVKDFSTVYRYLPIPDGVYNDNAKIQTDDQYFNKAIIYNGQQCSGLLELVPKPMNNLKAYMQYPIYNSNSKTITYTKSDNFYQYNNFWSVVKDKSLPLFVTGCESLSIDKVLNQANMDYGVRSFKKDTIRAKGLLIRHILDNKSDARIISHFIVAPAQVSYK